MKNNINRIKVILALATVALFASACLDSNGEKHGREALVMSWADHIELNGIGAFSNSIESLRSSSESYCVSDTPSTSLLAAAQDDWANAHQYWNNLLIVKLNWLPTPLISAVLDAEATIQQIENGVDTLTENAFTATALNNSGTQQRGMGALEYLLFDRAVDAPLTQNECSWVLGYVDQLQGHAESIQAAWDASKDDFIDPIKIEDGFLNRTDVLAGVLNNVQEWLYLIEVGTFDKPLGVSSGFLNQHLAPAYTSQKTLASLKANFQFLEVLLVDGQYDITHLLVELQYPDVAADLSNRVSQLVAQVTNISTELAVVTQNDAAYLQYLELHTAVLDLAKYFDYLIPQMGGQVGFNSADGD